MPPKQTPLVHLSPAMIRRNSDNPRLIFHEDEMNQLLDSIKEQGIRVPLSVYKNRDYYVLIDGERRWRCARRLNLSNVPTIVLPKPSKLENLLMMFNIHNVRVAWDLMPMAVKMGEIRTLATKNGVTPTAKQLAAMTGVRMPTVKRALELLDLPKKYRTLLLEEARKPRNLQKIKPDLFVETYKSLHAVEKYTPEVFEQVSKQDYVDAMVGKYLSGVVDNVVSYRDVSKMARAERAGSDKARATRAIIHLVRRKGSGIEEAYQSSVASDYLRRDIVTRGNALTRMLREYGPNATSDAELRGTLQALMVEIRRLLQ